VNEIDKPVITNDVFARLKVNDSSNVGNLVVREGTISAHTPRDGQGDATLNMLSYYYAWCIIAIDSSMSFVNLKKALKGTKIHPPKELKMFMEKCDITSKTLVVITDCPKKPQKSETQTSEDLDMMSRLSHITFMHRSRLTWFVPTDGFLKVLPKEDVLNLKEGRTQFFEISKDVRLKIKAPIERSLEYEFKRIRLFSKEPNMVYEVTLTSGKILYVDASLMPSDWIKSLQEPWLLEHLTSLCHVSGSLGIYFGMGKKSSGQRGVNHSISEFNVWWYDPSNKYNLCVCGSIVNWLHAEGLTVEASKMKEWALAQNLSTVIEDQMEKALDYISNNCHIGNVKIQFHSEKGMLKLQETVKMVIDFPAPVILEFWCMSSHHTHSVVVSKKIVYDLQDRNTYDLSEKSLIRKLSLDTMLVSARYLFLRRPKEVHIASCPINPINAARVKVPYFGELIHCFGEKKNNKKKKRKKKRKYSAME